MPGQRPSASTLWRLRRGGAQRPWLHGPGEARVSARGLHCTKVGYTSEVRARAALRLLRDRGLHHYYRCPRCALFHLASGPS